MAAFSGGGGATMFEDYQQEFAIQLAAAQAKMQSGADATAELRSAGAALKSMTMEARKLPPAERKQGKKDVAVAKKQLEKLERTALLGAGGGTRVNDSSTTADQKAKLTAATSRSKQSTQRLRDANKTLMETQDVAKDTMAELERNRATIQRNVDRAKHANSQMGVAESITYKMKHWWRNL